MGNADRNQTNERRVAHFRRMSPRQLANYCDLTLRWHLLTDETCELFVRAQRQQRRDNQTKPHTTEEG